MGPGFHTYVFKIFFQFKFGQVSFYVFMPFVSNAIVITYFKNLTYNDQIEALNKTVHDFTDHDYMVGSAGSLLIDLNAEKGIKANIYHNKKVCSIFDPCLTSKGNKDMYIDFKTKTKFHQALINYYTLGYENQEFNVDDFFSMRKLKLKILNKISIE